MTRVSRSHTCLSCFLVLQLVVLFFGFASGDLQENPPQQQNGVSEGVGQDNVVPTSNVISLTSETFESALKDKRIALIEFYAPWCGICKRLAPEWEKAADLLVETFAQEPAEDLQVTQEEETHKDKKEKKSKEEKKKDKKKKGEETPVIAEVQLPREDGRVLFKVDCTVEKDICAQQDITGYPTIKLFKSGNDTGIQYRGEKSAAAIVTFASKLLLPPVKLLRTKEEVTAFKAGGDDVTIIGYFKEKYVDERAAFESAAAELQESGITMSVGIVVNSELAKQLEAEGEFLPLLKENSNTTTAEETPKEETTTQAEEATTTTTTPTEAEEEAEAPKEEEVAKEKKGKEKEKKKEKKEKKEKNKENKRKLPLLVLYRKVDTQTFYFGTEELKQFYPPIEQVRESEVNSTTTETETASEGKKDKKEKEKGKEKEKEKEKDKEKKKKKKDNFEKEKLKAWMLEHKLPLLTKFDKRAFGNDQPAALVFIELPTDEASVSSTFMDIMEKVYFVAKNLRAKGQSLRFGWIDKDEWDGTRLGLDGGTYPALAISELQKLNHHYAFGGLTLENVDTLEAWIDSFFAGALPLTIVSQNPSEAYQLGESIVTIVANTYEEEVLKQDKNVVVLFHSPHCGTSRKYYPLFQEFARRYKDDERVLFRAGDGWANDFPQALRLTGMPDMRIFLKGDKSVNYHYAGGPDVTAFEEWLNKHLDATTTMKDKDEL